MIPYACLRISGGYELNEQDDNYESHAAGDDKCHNIPEKLEKTGKNIFDCLAPALLLSGQKLNECLDFAIGDGREICNAERGWLKIAIAIAQQKSICFC